MKKDSIKKQLKALGIKCKSKEKDGKRFFRLRDFREVGLEKLLEKAGEVAAEKTEKGILIPKNEQTLKKIIAALTDKTAAGQTVLKNNIEAELERFSEMLKRRKYSERTQKNYKNHFKAFLKKNELKDFLSFSAAELNKYLSSRAKQRAYSTGDTNMHINALRFYYEEVLGKKFQSQRIQRPKRHKKVPEAMDEKTLQSVLRQTQNLKHKALLIFAYKSGMKTKEIINLKVAERTNAKNKMAKKKANDETVLPRKYQITVAEYLEKYSPKKYFFESNVPGQPLTIRAVQKTLKVLKEKAGLVKKNSFKKEEQFT